MHLWVATRPWKPGKTLENRYKTTWKTGSPKPKVALISERIDHLVKKGKPGKPENIVWYFDIENILSNLFQFKNKPT